MREKVEMVGCFIGCLEFNGVMNQLCLKSRTIMNYDWQASDRM